MGIRVKNLSKKYSDKPLRLTAGGLFGVHNKTLALRDVNLEISAGESVGIIGENGSGKSTLLKLLCGITAPSEGEIHIDGKISALLELGAGFNPEYTGISNIYLNGAVLGLSRAQIKALLPEICEFADIGDYINKPVKTYSDGMFLRLAFACATAVKPDILIVDEALAVGDFAFRCKCFAKITELKNSGAAVLIVSHDINAIRRLCTRAVWLDNGKIRMDGSVAEVTAAYMQHMTGCAPLSAENTAKTTDCGCINRFGSAVGSILSADLPSVQILGEEIELTCKLKIPNGVKLETTALSVSFKNSLGLDLTVFSTADKKMSFSKHGYAEVKFRYTCELCPGEYSVCVSLEDRGSRPIKYYDYADGITMFKVTADREYFGVVRTPAEMSLYEEK